MFDDLMIFCVNVIFFWALYFLMLIF